MHHMTTLDNLKKIIKSGKIISRNSLKRNFDDTADTNIIFEREKIGGKNLNDYVPFHLNEIQFSEGIPYNKKIYAKVAKENLVILCTEKENGDLFILYHPASKYKKECCDLKEFSQEFEKEKNKLKNNGRYDWRDNRTKQFFMSEILIKDEVLVNTIYSYIVYNEEVKNELKDMGIEKSKIIVNPSYFR